MKKLLQILLLLSSVALAACSRGTAGASYSGQHDYAKTLTFDGQQRTYHVHLPPAYNGQQSLPLVLVFHGLGGDGPGMVALTHMNTVADQQKFIVVYPDGLNRRWAFGKAPLLGGVDDPGFINALVPQLEKDLKIDQKRIYTTGMSNGGLFVEYLACQPSSPFAAFADVSATMPTILSLACKPVRAVPILTIHGTDDPIVPYNGGSSSIGIMGGLTAPQTAARWASIDGCNPTPATSNLPDKVNDGTHIQQNIYGGCQQGSQVVFYIVQGGGHTWPSGFQYLPVSMVGKTSRQMDASQVIWEFFQKHVRS
ncbi:MAG TPA: PHB depolymerase family esterase [Ktedonobacterales bacterium]|jgi:polyhydroxybutyrate depolymerase